MSNDASIRNLLSYLPARASDAMSPQDLTGATEGLIALSRGRAAWLVLATHVVTLSELGVIDEGGFAALARGVEANRTWSESADLPLRTLHREMIERVDAQVPSEFSGAIGLGLANEEWLATTSRILWKHLLLAAIAATNRIRASLVSLAETHANTNMPAFVGGRAAQPTTLGHLLGGVIAPLRSGERRLQAAFEAVDRSPLGAGQLSGDVIVPDRDRQAELLGFASPIPNTLDAVMSVEDVIAAAEAIAAVMAPIRRLLGEIIAWVRTDPTSFVLTRDWQTIPEPVNPLLVIPEQIELLIQELRGVEETCRAVTFRLRESAYGPIGSQAEFVSGTATDLTHGVTAVLDRAGRLLTEGMLINRAFLGNRAGRGYTTGGDLAIFLMQEESIPPSAARVIAGMVLSRIEEQGLEVSGISQDMIDSAAMLTIGREIKVEMETLGRFLAPRRFLDRRQVAGSPAPAMTRDWLATELASLGQSERWHADARSSMDAAIVRLEGAIAAAASEAGDDR
jgi:argininosuccinate lyase